MTETLERKIKINPFYITVVGIFLACAFFIYSISSNEQFNTLDIKFELCIGIAVFGVMTSFLVLFGQRRFLRKVDFNFTTSKLETTSVIEWVKNSYDFSDIKEIKLIKSVGFGNKTDGFRNLNLVLRLKGKIQPQILEIKSEALATKANDIISKITTANTH